MCSEATVRRMATRDSMSDWRMTLPSLSTQKNNAEVRCARDKSLLDLGDTGSQEEKQWKEA